MKKRICLFLVLTLILSLFACSGSSNDNKGNLTESNNGNSTEGEVETTPNPNDDNSMFIKQENKREVVLEYIRDMATIKWTPNETFSLYGKYQAWSYNLTYQKGNVYFGPPFLVDSRCTSEEFENSLKDGVYMGSTSNSDCIGSACYDAVFVALIQACPSITFKSTADMLPKNNTGLVAVGDWDWSASKQDTPTLKQNNTLDTMSKAYALLKPGDVVLKHIVKQDAGHARIVNGGPVLYYLPNGKIDPDKSYITTIEQTNSWDKEVSHKTHWWVDRVYTFRTLYDTYFVPLTPSDYTNEDAPDAYMTVSNLTTQENIGNARKLEGDITSNHYITEVAIELYNQDGKLIYTESTFPKAKKYDLSKFKHSLKLREYMSGSYTLKLKGSLPTGTKELASYKIVLE